MRAGEIFADRFEIDRVAGAGGMGTIYRARDLLSGELIALKLLHGSGEQNNDSERFAREAQLLSALRHPGIVSYVAHGQTAKGQRFLAMQWLDGEDLAQRLARGPLSLDDSLLLLEHVAESLAFAHDCGIIHRDRSHKHKICLRTGHSALHHRRTDYAFLPRPHAPSWLHLS